MEGGLLVQQLADPAPHFFFLRIQVSMLAEGRTSCDDGIQCPVCLLLRAFLLLITKQPDALLPSVVLSLQRGVLGLRGTVMHNSIYSHLQPSANASCFTAKPLYYFSFFSHVCKRISHRFPSTSRGSQFHILILNTHTQLQFGVIWVLHSSSQEKGRKKKSMVYAIGCLSLTHIPFP